MITIAYTVWGVESEITLHNWRDDQKFRAEIAAILGDPVTAQDVFIIRKR
jgi:hypothetical protein